LAGWQNRKQGVANFAVSRRLGRIVIRFLKFQTVILCPGTGSPIWGLVAVGRIAAKSSLSRKRENQEKTQKQGVSYGSIAHDSLLS
jgi:hypothetical protein